LEIINHPRLENALKRSLMELNNCVLKRRALNQLLSLKSVHGLDFFRVCEAALQNDMYAGAHRALDKHRDSASFWYILNIAQKLVSDAAEKAGIQITEVERLSDKLRSIRDKVHFHVDKAVLDNPNKPWVDADMTGNEFIWLTESTHEILRRVLFSLTGEDYPIPEYHGEDIELIMRAYKKEHSTGTSHTLDL